MTLRSQELTEAAPVISNVSLYPGNYHFVFRCVVCECWMVQSHMIVEGEFSPMALVKCHLSNVRDKLPREWD